LGLRLQTSTQWGAIKKIIATQPGVRYRVKLGYVHGGSVGGGMKVYNGGVESTQSIGGSGWLNKTTERVFEFVAESDMVMLKFFSGEVSGVEANMYLSKVEISIANSNHYSRIRGDKTYELSNHLGNVLATITDRKLGFSNNTSNNIASHYQAEVTSATDYYPFGSPMSKRSVFDYKSKYGFNSAEKHNELDNLDGLDYDLGARFYSSKLGRMFSPDPRESEYPWQSTYAYFCNSPIVIIDYKGEGGEGDEKTGVITATVYFQFDNSSSLSSSDQANFIKAFESNVKSTWNTYSINGVNVNVNQVQFLPLPSGKSESNLLENENLLTVGMGGDADPTTVLFSKSYINSDRQTGYIYEQNWGREAAHEFGHLLGLSDSYHEGTFLSEYGHYGYFYDRFSVPMSKNNVLAYPDYDPSNNLFSQGGQLTPYQLKIAFSKGKVEDRYPTATVVATEQEWNNGNGVIRTVDVTYTSKGIDVKTQNGKDLHFVKNLGLYYGGNGASYYLYKKGQKRYTPTKENRTFLRENGF
jgi:RHS repeat-associated protein